MDNGQPVGSPLNTEKPMQHLDQFCSITDSCLRIDCKPNSDHNNNSINLTKKTPEQDTQTDVPRNSMSKFVNCEKLTTNCENSKLADLSHQKLSKSMASKQKDSDQLNCITSEPIETNELALNEWDDFMARLSPINVTGWNETSFLGKVVSILRAPLLFVTILTVPVVDNEQRINNWCRPLNSLHCLTVPGIIILTRSWSSSSTSDLLILGCPIKMLIIVPFLGLALFVFKTTNAYKPPKYHALFAYIGFIMSVLWVYFLATEIISLLKTFGIIFSMSDTAIGLGVLAWGNSLGDIVANLSLADAGYPRMALGASIGAPLLNLLLGFGLSFTISLRRGESSPIAYSPTISLLCSTLALILVSLMLSTLAPPNRSKKLFGYLLIGSYGVYFALACCIECGLIKF